MSATTVDSLNRAFLELKSKNKDTREKASYELLHLVQVAQNGELSGEKFHEYYSTIQQRIGQLVVTSQETSDKIGGILAIERLMTFESDDAQQQNITKFANYLRAALRSGDNDVLVYAAKALGHLAKPGGALIADLVDSEIKLALESLTSVRVESRRFAAVLVVRELAKSSPTLLYAFVPQILECVWAALRDVQVLIRETAAEAIGACFEILSARDALLRSQWFAKMYDEATSGLKSSNIDHLHGSLLCIRELLQKGNMFMHSHYKETCDIALRLKDHKDIKIRAQIVIIIPILAGYAPEEFSKSYLHKFMTYLLGQLKKDSARNESFLAIGKIANAVGSNISPYLDSILVYIRDALSIKARNRPGVKEGPVFECISMLSIAVGQTLTKYMDALMDPMFACGLSDGLTQALVDMAHYIPPIRPVIQEKLLDLLSLVLCGKPFKPLGCPENRLPPMPAFAKDWATQGVSHKDSEIALALHTLGSFNFAGHVLNEFVRDVAIKYVDNDNPEIRKASALTCCQLFIQDPVIQQTSFHAIRVVGEVISKLLSVGVGDSDPDIRRLVLKSLDTKFDKHLSFPENIRQLVLAVNESDYEVRQAAMVILGRLTTVNPAYVFPPLRKLLLNLMQGVRYSDDAQHEEEGARLISLCVSNASQIVKPYIKDLTKILLLRADDPNPSVSSAVIRAIGDLASVGGTDMLPFIPQLMPAIINALQDLSSHAKRDASLRALGQLASNSGYVIQPYIDHPHLLDLLINIIRTEQHGSLRQETIKLIGILGALDPYKHQQIVESALGNKAQVEGPPITDADLVVEGIQPSQDEYYTRVVMNTLLHSVLRDNSLAQYHSAVIEAMVAIFKTLGLKCVPFLGQIVPTFLTIIRTAPHIRLDAYFNQLAILVSVVREHIRPFVKDLVSLAVEFWDISYAVQSTVLALVDALSRSLESEFKIYVSKLLPLMMKVLDKDNSPRRQATDKVLHTILVLGTSAEEFMWLILPRLVKTYTKSQLPIHTRKACIDTVGKILRQVNISDYAGLIVHSLTDVLKTKEPQLRTAAMDCICALIFQMGQEFEPYVSTVRKTLTANQIQHHNFDVLTGKIRSGEPLPQNLSPNEQYGVFADDSTYANFDQRKLAVNQEHLKQSWSATQKSTREDWQEWLRRFSIELLKESPSNALRACAGLASLYQPLAKDLFNSAFISCWTELYEQYQEDLVRSLEIAIQSQNIPREILQVLLNLAEFMEHDDKALPIDIGLLGMFAGKCHAYAKALHYKELEFEEEKTPSVVEALISINNKLQQTDAAVGILRTAQGYRDFELKETWFEKLGRWDEALVAYQKREREDPNQFETTVGKMRCLHALGEWDLLSNLAQEKWNLAAIDNKRSIAALAAAAAWGLGQFELMDTYLEVMKPLSPDRSFFGAILSLHQNQFTDAIAHIERAREGLDAELSSLLGESYTRAYGVVVRVQMLAELEEIMNYKKSKDDPAKQEVMRITWTKRLKGCERNVETWQRMLKVRALVLEPKDNIDMWIKFANLCRKSGRSGLAEKSLRALQGVMGSRAGDDPMLSSSVVPEVNYAMLKYRWSIGDNEGSLDRLQHFTHNLSNELAMQSDKLQQELQNQASAMNGSFEHTNMNRLVSTQADLEKTKKLLAKCFLKLGEWQTHFTGGNWNSRLVSDILRSYHSATYYNPNGYKAWHAWALANFEVANATVSQADTDLAASAPEGMILAHVVPAIQGFFRSIALSSTSSLQDTLRLLTLWFAHGGHIEVNQTVTEGFATVSIDTWLEVIPQLIARINQENVRVRTTIHRLLAEIGKAHPQALVYPLTVAMKSNVVRRSQAAKAIVQGMGKSFPNLVEQAELVSNELVRVAVLWHELWHEGLEEASRLYFGNHDVEGMFAALRPLHERLEAGPTTLREISFVQAFSANLREALNWCRAYGESNDVADLNQAWDLYYSVWSKISRQLPQLIHLDLSYISPRLKEARDLELAVPGTYQSGKPIIRIMNVDRMMTVIPSKQRPRKMMMRGSDGVVYTYLLKGHEDIRQDERVMQLFGLVNTLLNADSESFKRHLQIQPFPAIPLSQSSGLLGWVVHGETFHNLIKEYRETRRILLNIEHRIMLQMAPNFDNLTLMQKVEVFSYAMDNTTGKDLYRVLWLRSKSSESWLERRTNYTRSLAVMSMVGYILGLGDRHPSNLMLNKVTGTVVHIDFGDCFEVAIHREKFPERVPFRLTRMLTYAMEVSNIDGSYKISCEAVMRVIRDNKESIMAVLEAFVHDPLLSWRLGNRNSPVEPSFRSERRMSLLAGQDGAEDVEQEFAIGRPPTTSNAPPGSLRHRRTLTGGGPPDVGGETGIPNGGEANGMIPNNPTARNLNNNFPPRPAGGPQANGLIEADANYEQNNPRNESQNAQAVKVLERVKEKLTGRDFKPNVELGVEEQVARLIAQATSVENLCQHYIGWCSFW
ncbi:phosphatidylinositol kinase- protein kinase tor1 [Agyrium rufum]|nr:phosphatidylinositol kinase- protein kinase tor1 [Agyrium rufum]